MNSFLISCLPWISPVLCPQSLVIPCTVRSLWSSPVLSAVSGHLLYCVHSLWSISCTMSAVSGHLLYCVRSLWSISCTLSTLQNWMWQNWLMPYLLEVVPWAASMCGELDLWISPAFVP
ncbi:unnamed protein product [Staurois parvus]|uniref:Uncharacterized protein n=1 Tax=Staurois parvus TaxID=386267 RepID=A0ABN9H1L8_9NEOB|nr:unnamed protein product [Staurois parvus]